MVENPPSNVPSALQCCHAAVHNLTVNVLVSLNVAATIRAVTDLLGTPGVTPKAFKDPPRVYAFTEHTHTHTHTHTHCPKKDRRRLKRGMKEDKYLKGRKLEPRRRHEAPTLVLGAGFKSSGSDRLCGVYKFLWKLYPLPKITHIVIYMYI